MSALLRGALGRRLLAWAAAGCDVAGDRGVVRALLGEANDAELRWFLAAGLGPMLYRAAASAQRDMPAALRETLVAADLTARVRHAARVETACETIDACNALGVPVILLKGISISEQCYPDGHLRPMSDIDVLVPTRAYAAVESALVERGYDIPPFDAPPGMHHGPPLHHSARDTWVELHHQVFPSNSEFRRNLLFDAASLQQRAVRSTFHGRAVLRLADELQVAYIAASWFSDLTTYRIQPSFLPSMFDAVLLLRATRASLDWNRLLDWLDNEMAAASVHVLLTYLTKRGLAAIDESVLKRVRRRQRFVGPLQRRLVHMTVDRYLLGARPWDRPWPPPLPGRYSVRYQFQKRVLRRWAGTDPA